MTIRFGIKSRIKSNFHKLIHGRCVILLYHRVTEIGNDPNLLTVTPENFEWQLEYLKNNYNLLKVSDFLHYYEKGKKFPDKSILLTFDDGYVDNYQEALPILERQALQALFFLATDNIGTTNEFWWDALDRTLFSAKAPNFLTIQVNGVAQNYKLNTFEGKKATYFSLHRELKLLPSTKRIAIIKELEKWANELKERSSHRVINVEELLKFKQSDSVVIGAHTCSHPVLSSLDREEQLLEISQSKEQLEDLIGEKIRFFAYPFGSKADYNEDSIAICQKLGFDLSFANYPKFVSKNKNKYDLPRSMVLNWDKATFIRKMNNNFKFV